MQKNSSTRDPRRGLFCLESCLSLSCQSRFNPLACLNHVGRRIHNFIPYVRTTRTSWHSVPTFEPRTFLKTAKTARESHSIPPYSHSHGFALPPLPSVQPFTQIRRSADLNRPDCHLCLGLVRLDLCIPDRRATSSSLASASFTVTVLPAGLARSQASSKPFSLILLFGAFVKS